MCSSMKQYPGVCNNVAYDGNSDEVARVDDLLDSSEKVRHLTSSERGTDCKSKVSLISI